jgi:hypothetical protein
MPSSQKLHIWLKPNCTWMFIGWSSTILRFFVPIWNSKWWLRQKLVNCQWDNELSRNNLHVINVRGHSRGWSQNFTCH